ncbi:hypothetical protein DSECCO2_472770 [anaerobic digester metagenome]
MASVVELVRTFPPVEFTITVAPSRGLTWPYSFTVTVPLMIGSEPVQSLGRSIGVLVVFPVPFIAAADVLMMVRTNANANINIIAFFLILISNSPIYFKIKPCFEDHIALFDSLNFVVFSEQYNLLIIIFSFIILCDS